MTRHQAEPEYDDLDPAPLEEWGDAQWAEYAARTRHNVTFRVRAGGASEVEPTDGLRFDPVDG
ncbi:hypothetical protein [Plantactinospora sonchi]|uniref:Uncharacterized protein n=1 Tax=Plantactinospora sonchi TaxID=1544735 RepID=A0ABU7RN48_9ACTN